MKWLLVSFLLFLFFIQIFLGARLFSVAMDEQAHLPAGFIHLQTKEIEFRKSNAPFIGMLAALPGFLFSKPKIDTHDPQILNNNFWDFGNKFLFSNNADKLIFSGRLAVIALSVLLAFYVFKWSKDLFGFRAGLFSLFLFVFIPVVIGHSSLISTDVGLAVFFFISSYYFWKSLKLTTSDVQRTSDVKKLKYKILAGIFMGMAMGSKFSGVLLLPLFVLFALAISDVRWTSDIKKRLLGFLGIILPVFIIGFLVLWAIYFFPKNLNFYSGGLNLIYAEDANLNYPVYLNGDFKKGGWWYYFLEGFAVKTPIPFLIFLIWSLLLFGKYRNNFSDKLLLLAPAAVLFFFTSLQAHNLGVRYLIPTYPFLAVYAGGLLSQEILNYNTKIKILLILVLSVWHAFSSISSHPNQLAYFNELVGGTDNGYKYMDDSNIDWGHDLKRLKNFIDKNPDAKIVYIWRQGDRALDYYKIGREKNIIDLKENWWAEPKGKYAVSSHFLVRAKIMSQEYNEPSLDWLSLYKPASKIGQSFFVYEF